MARNENIAYPGSAWRPALTHTPDAYQKRLKTSPNAVEVAWWRAVPDPTFEEKRGAAAFPSGRGQWLRERQAGEFWTIIDGERLLRRYFQPGTWETGDIAVVFDPSEFDLTEHDWIVQIGQGGSSLIELPAGSIDARTFTQKHTIVRGEGTVDGPGAASVAGTAVTGVGTAFLSFFRPGDVFKLPPTRFAARVVSVAGDGALTLDAAAPAAYQAMPYAKGVDRLLYPPAARLTDVRDAARAYTPGTHCRISAADEETVEWLSPVDSPPPGTRYGVVYDYYVRYVVTELGTKGAVVRGVPLLSIVAARPWKPETNAR